MKSIKSCLLLRLIKPLILLSSGLLICCPDIASAQFYARPELTLGMTKSEVQARWGKPKSIVDKSLIAETTWLFAATDKLPEQTVTFHSNKLFNVAGGAPMIDPAAFKKPESEVKKVSAAQAFMPIVSQKDLNEVLKQVPSEDEAAKAGADKDRAASPAKFN